MIKLTSTLITALLLTWSGAIADETENFVGISAGYSHLNVDKQDKQGSITLGDELEEKGYNFIIEAGHNYNNNIDITLNYQRVKEDDTHLNNYYIKSDYNFNSIQNFTPYLGVLIGYSELHWDKSPINTKSNDYTSDSYLIGTQAGVTYPITQHFKLHLMYQFAYMNHTTIIEPTSITRGELKHNYLHTVDVGLRYSF